MRHISPLRYPGGKGYLSDFLETVIDLNGLRGCSYFEPFAGGAGAALQLLTRGIVSEIHLNDLDPRLWAFWRSILNDTDRFVDRVLSVPLTLEEWKRQRAVSADPTESLPFDLGFSTFYLNRCNRSGIIMGAAPIGGYKQAGQWQMGARFYRTALARRIRHISSFRDRIHVSQLDALEFLQFTVIPASRLTSTFTYIDPPYYLTGNRLYMSTYGDADHSALAAQLKAATSTAWVASYNDCEFIANLYSGCSRTTIPVRYSMQKKQTIEELVFGAPGVKLPVVQTSSR